MKWNVQCKDITESVFIPENTYIEDCETHIRYGLAKKPIVINPNTYSQSISYETVFKALPPSARKIRLVSENLVISEIDLKKEAKNKPLIAENPPREENDIIETPISASVVTSDVDDISGVSSKLYEKRFAVIIANEDYTDEKPVPYAKRDGEVFKNYCIQVLGVPEKNVRLICNATLNNIKRQMSWLAQVMEAYNGEEEIILYYAGHGIPDEATQMSYLLPVDGFGQDVSTGYSLDDLYAALNSKPSKSIMVFLDACFSGTKRDGDMMTSARGIAIKAKPQNPQGNMIVFSASQGDETAYSYKKEGHGMFTYYLLKKLQESKGDVTLGELSDYIVSKVKKTSIVENGKIQTPCVSASGALGESWKNIKLK